jgi:hypothetical protein
MPASILILSLGGHYGFAKNFLSSKLAPIHDVSTLLTTVSE